MSDADRDRLLEEAMQRETVLAGEHIDDGVLLQYRAHQLDAAAEQKIDEHLATCADCRALLVALAEPVAAKQRSWARGALAGGRRARWWVLGAAAAAAAVLLLVIVRPPPRDLSRYRLEGPSGLVKLERSPAGQTDRVTPKSRIELRLLPPEPSDDAIFAALFAERGGELVRADARIEERRGVVRAEVTGRALFGDAFGPARMIVVLANEEAALEQLEGRSVEELDRRGTRSWSFDLVYERGSGP